jgi:hypothetical protein
MGKMVITFHKLSGISGATCRGSSVEGGLSYEAQEECPVPS